MVVGGGYERNCRNVVSHLINGQNSTADHLSLGGDKGGHDQTGAVTEAQARLHIQGLQHRWRQTKRQTVAECVLTATDH